MAETRLDQLKETIDDKQAKIGDRIHALLLLLRSRNGKEENPEDQTLNDKELVETEVATEFIESEDRALKNEANATMISAIVKEEPISQLQVLVSKLEPSLRFHNASPDFCEDFKSLVGFDGLFDHEEAKLQVSYVKARAHQLFDKMSLGVRRKMRHIKWPKCWRFKFKQRKQQRGKLRPAHKLINRGDVMEDDHVYQEGLPLWLLVRFKFWKFKFMNMKLQKMMREHGFASYLKLMYDKGEHDELFIMAKAVSMRFLLGIMLGITGSDAGQGQQAVFEQILMLNEWLQTSLVLQQVMRSKKIKFPKRWMFKYKAPQWDNKVFETSDQCISLKVFVSVDCETKHNQPTLRFLMNTKQSCLSLWANRVWDPGGSNSEID